MKLKALMPFFGGKAKIAHRVWQALGDVKMFLEPFFGSGAVLLNRPVTSLYKYEVVNDADGYIANVWRALQGNPDEVAKVCDYPCNHADLMARKAYMIKHGKELLEKLVADPKYYDTEIAGYWIWCASHWIGSGLTRPTQRPHRPTQRPHRPTQRPHLTRNQGDEVPDVRDPYHDGIYVWFRQLAERLRDVKVVCGDWTRVCGGNWQAKNKPCGIYFDPPYGEKANRDMGIYDQDSLTVAGDVAKWAAERGKNKDYRIVLSGYYEEHEWLLNEGWSVHQWEAGSSYSHIEGSKNRFKEALFMSPGCNQISMFGINPPAAGVIRE